MASKHTITRDQFEEGRRHRYGTANPERVENPAWEWAVRMGESAYGLRRAMGLEQSYACGRSEPRPDWCFDRFGMSRVEMGDGRVIHIAGEHEDFYDPDFCIYNDVIVRRGDEVEIYAYPESVFPPTDFHSATLIGRSIWIIGSLGYQGRRGGERTPVFALDTDSYHIREVTTTGESPGWLSRHRAALLDDGVTVEIRDGRQITHPNGVEKFRFNFDVYRLNTQRSEWSRTTDHSSWRQFTIAYDAYIDMEVMRRDFESPPWLKWRSGEILRDLGYPVTLASPECDDDAEDGSAEDSDPFRHAHMLEVDGVAVRVADHYTEILVLIEGVLPDRTVDRLIRQIKEIAVSSGRRVNEVNER